MNPPTFHSLRLLFFGGLFTLLCNMPAAAQAPKRSTSPAQAPAPNRYMTTITRFHNAIGSGDVKTIIDVSYFHQTALRRTFQGQPQAVWPQLKDAYYRSVSAQMTSQPDTLAALREGAAAMDGDPTRDIRMIRAFLPPSATLRFLEQQPLDFDTMEGRFAGTYVFVGVTYADLTASPISTINFIKYIILRFVLSRDTALIYSVTTIPVSQQLHTKPYPASALPYVQSVFFNKYLATYNDPNLWASIDQEARSIGKDFAIKLYVAIAQSHPNPVPLNAGWPDPRARALQVLNELQYAGLNALLVPLIKPGEQYTDRSQAAPPTLAAVRAVLPATGSRSDEPTATLRQTLMKEVARETVAGGQINTLRGPKKKKTVGEVERPENARPYNDYLDALSRLDGEQWGPVELYLPQPPGGNVADQKSLYVRLFNGLVSDDAAKYIDLSSPNAREFATIRRVLVKCPDRNTMPYQLNGCKADFAVVPNTVVVVDNGRIQCTVTITDTSHTFSTPAKNSLLYTVEMTLVPQGLPSNEWKVVASKIVSGAGPISRAEATDNSGTSLRPSDVRGNSAVPTAHIEPKLTGGLLYLVKADDSMTLMQREMALFNMEGRRQQVVQIDTPRATVRFTQGDNARFLVTTPPGGWLSTSGYRVFMLEVNNGKRTLVINSKVGISCSIQPVGSEVTYMQITPKKELTPGEYAFVRTNMDIPINGLKAEIPTFGVDPAH